MSLILSVTRARRRLTGVLLLIWWAAAELNQWRDNRSAARVSSSHSPTQWGRQPNGRRHVQVSCASGQLLTQVPDGDAVLVDRQTDPPAEKNPDVTGRCVTVSCALYKLCYTAMRFSPEFSYEQTVIVWKH